MAKRPPGGPDDGAGKPPMPKNQPDNRKHARFEMFEYAAVYRGLGEEPVSTLIVDISVGGLQVRSKRPLRTGTLCETVIGHGGQQTPTSVTVEVRHCTQIAKSDLFACGLRFKPQNPQERMELVDYLHEVFQRRREQFIN